MTLNDLITKIQNNEIYFDDIENDFVNNNGTLINNIDNEIVENVFNLICGFTEILLCELSHENIYEMIYNCINDNLDDMVNEMIEIINKHGNENIIL